jgi:hypothetical protein
LIFCVEENDGNRRSFDSVIRNCANDLAQDDTVGGAWREQATARATADFSAALLTMRL